MELILFFRLKRPSLFVFGQVLVVIPGGNRAASLGFKVSPCVSGDFAATLRCVFVLLKALRVVIPRNFRRGCFAQLRKD